MSADDLVEKTVAELANLLDGGEVSSVELVEAYLGRIQRLNPTLNAYITVCGDEALEAARRCDANRATGTARGSLNGIPVAVKDQMHMRGVPTTGGSFLDVTPGEDSTVVARLRSAGAILLGKLNLSEFAFGGNIRHPFGTPRNPWNVERQPGHSSSGAGVAVAASLCAAAIGEDTGGSIRIPAAWCGVTGLRPTWGRVSRYGILPICWSMDQAGPMTKSVEDCALVYRAIAGHDANDPYTSTEPVGRFTPTPDLRGLRVGLIQESLTTSLMEPQVSTAVQNALEVLKEAGAIVSEVSIPLMSDAGVISTTICDSDGAYVHGHRLRSRAKDYDGVTRRRLLAGSLISAQAYQKAQRLRVLLRNQVLATLEVVDVLLSPTQPTAAAMIETSSGLNSKEDVLRRFAGPRGATAPFNLAAVPAMSVPCGFTEDGLPIGLQLAALPFEEATLFQVGYVYQERTPWHTHRPPV